MSTTYITPQRAATGHAVRFVRRAAERESAIGGNTAETGILSWFEPQSLVQGERRTVYAEFSLGETWTAVSAQFTLLAAGVPAAGYNGASASLASDTTGRFWTATAPIDLTAEAAHPLASGIYEGEFLVTTSGGEIVAAQGRITIENVEPESEPEPNEYYTDGGVG